MAVPYDLPMPDDKGWGMGSYGSLTVTLERQNRFDAVYEKVDAWQEALAKVANDREAAKNEVNKILGSFTTLAPALRAWPALWDLLPSDVQDKHKEIVERTKAEPVKVDLSGLEGLTAKLVMANINKKTGDR